MNIPAQMLQLQLDEGKWLLKNSTLSIKAVAEKIGFSDSLYFSRVFSKKFGCSPSEFKKNAQAISSPPPRIFNASEK